MPRAASSIHDTCRVRKWWAVNNVKSAGFEPNAAPPNWKARIGLGLLVFFVAGYLLLRYVTRDTQQNPPRLIGSVWTASVDGAPRIFFVTKEDRAEERSFDIDGAYTYEHSYSIYVLHARDPASGAAVGAARIARIETTSPDFKKYVAYKTLPDGPGILGPQADVLWLWNNGLEARSLRTLEPVWTQDKLKELNPEFAPLLPDDPKYARVLGKLGALLFKSQDARFLQIDRGSGKFLPVDEAMLAGLSTAHSKTADTAFSGLDADGRSLRVATSVGVLCRDALLDDGMWCALLTTDERANLKSDTGGLDGHDLGYKRLGHIEDWFYRQQFNSLKESTASVFRGSYELVPERNFLNKNEIRLDPGSIVPVSADRFLMAGFLARPNTQDVWSVGAPSANEPASAPAAATASGATDAKSYLILHRKALGEKSPWHLTRLALDGTIHWSRSIGLNDLDHLSDGQGAIVFAGTADVSELKGPRPDRMVFIDEITGASRMLNVASGEMAAGD